MPNESAGSQWLHHGIEISAILDVLPRAIIVTDAEGHILMWNHQAEVLYGWTREEVLGRLVGEVLVRITDRESARQIIESVRAGHEWTGDFTVLRRSGDPVRVWVTDRPLHDKSGATVAIVGASEDVTEQRLLEQRAADLTEHLRLALEAGEFGTFRWDMTTGETRWDSKLEQLFGLQPGEFDGTFDTWVRLLHPDDRAAVLATVETAVAEKKRYTVEHRVVWPDGTVRWLRGAGQVTLDDRGDVTGTIGCTADVTTDVVNALEREELTRQALAAAERERVHGEQLQFLSDVNDAIASADDEQELIANVTRVAVPVLGDWCSLYVVPESGGLPRIETAHADPAMVEYAHELQERFPYDPNAAVGMAHVIRTGTAEFHPNIDQQFIESIDATDEERSIVHDLELRSAITVPLINRGRVLGGLQLVMTRSRRHYSNDDLALAEAVASRIAGSLDNVRLRHAQRVIASTLQGSLLPDVLPAIPGIELAVRYWATGDGVTVGGDFYDVFAVSPDEWAVVIGDVCGTGPRAAAVTGLVRHTIASAAWHGDDHATVLANLNATMLARDRQGPFCTAVYGTMQRVADAVTFSFASAGHPLPIVVRSDGSAAFCGRYGTLAGLGEQFKVTPSSIDLAPGDAIVLYTDGITDVAPPHGISDDQLLSLVSDAAHATASAEQLAQRIQRAIFTILPLAKRHDDIALLILRVANG